MKYVTQEIVDKLKRGDENAFNEVYKHYYTVVFYMAVAYFKNDATAEDIVQEVFIELNKHLDKIESPQVLTVWINKIAYTKCMSIFRKKNIQTALYEDEMEKLEDTSIDSDILDVINRKEINNLIKNKILKLDYDLQIVGLLRFYEELSIKDIANIVEIPEGTVKSRIHTVKKILRKELKSSGILKPLSIIPLLPINVKGAYQHILGESPPSNTNMITKKSISLLCVTTMVVVSSIIYVKETSHQIETNISVDTKYTNTNVPIYIDTNQEYDYYLINGVNDQQITNNGQHIVTLIKDGKEAYKQTLYVNTIDKETPILDNYKKEDNKVFMYIKDAVSGINAKTIRGTNNGNKIEDIYYDKNNQCISFEIQPTNQYIVYIDDHAKNTLEVSINLGEK